MVIKSFFYVAYEAHGSSLKKNTPNLESNIGCAFTCIELCPPPHIHLFPTLPLKKDKNEKKKKKEKKKNDIKLHLAKIVIIFRFLFIGIALEQQRSSLQRFTDCRCGQKLDTSESATSIAF